MTISDEQLNNSTNDSPATDDLTPIDNNGQAPIDSPEPTVPLTPTAPPAETNWQTEADLETDPLDGFNPENYVDGVEGDERYRILDLYLGYLCGQEIGYDPIKVRHILVKWDEHNRPPLGIMAIHAHIKANQAKWLRHHYLHKTGTWTPRR